MAEKIATRAAYGKALLELAEQEPDLVVLDADLSGSTQSAMSSVSSNQSGQRGRPARCASANC